MRDTMTIIGMAVVAIVIGYGAYMLAVRSGTVVEEPPATQSPATVIVPFTALARGEHSTVTRRTNYLITSADQLATLWQMIDAPGQTPAVDFSAKSVVAVFSGTKPTLGYDIRITQVGDSTARTVTVLLTSPGGSCLPAQATISPYEIVEISKTDLPFTHVDIATTTSCL